MSPDLTHCAVVDPGDPAPVFTFLEENNCKLTDILVTHHHHDHSGGVLELHEASDATVYGPSHEAIPYCDHRLSEGDTITLPDIDIQFKVLDVPAHTRGHIAFVGDNMLFCGDTLFAAGCGRLFEGTAEEMHRALNKFAALPGETKVYCGHEYTVRNLQFAKEVEPHNTAITARLIDVEKLAAAQTVTLPSRIDIERDTNPFMRCDQPAVKQAAEKHIGHALTSPSDVLQVIRDWKTQVH